jgi:hypothetical protein
MFRYIISALDLPSGFPVILNYLMKAMRIRAGHSEFTREARVACRIVVGNHFGDLSIDVKVILKWNVNIRV